jgi:hypothetical protein
MKRCCKGLQGDTKISGRDARGSEGDAEMRNRGIEEVTERFTKDTER